MSGARRLARGVAVLRPGPRPRVALGEVVHDGRRHDRDHSGRSRVAAALLLAPADDAIGGREPERAAAGEEDRGHVGAAGQRREPVRLTGPGSTAPDVNARRGSRRRDHHRASGLRLGIGPVPDPESVGE